MPSAELERLVQLGQLKIEAPGRDEIEGLIRSGAARLADAGKATLSLDSRFDLIAAAQAVSWALRTGGSA